MTENSRPSKQVALLHGLCRSARSMSKLESALTADRETVFNIEYPSRKYPIEQLAESVRATLIEQTDPAQPIHFVTHSMGGILVRQIQKSNPLSNIGRVVMLAPPNQGSEVVDKLAWTPVFKWLNGPAGQQLGTAPDGFIAQLGPVDFDCTVLTGDRSMNWINSLLIPGPDDGKVSTESAKVRGMASYRIVHTTHPIIMSHQKVISETIHFLNHGSFS
jgi:pimeloyl-ACP methyl ester carboxylesterase